MMSENRTIPPNVLPKVTPMCKFCCGFGWLETAVLLGVGCVGLALGLGFEWISGVSDASLGTSDLMLIVAPCVVKADVGFLEVEPVELEKRVDGGTATLYFCSISKMAIRPVSIDSSGRFHTVRNYVKLIRFCDRYIPIMEFKYFITRKIY
jgi:hypothetical protein